MWLLFYRITFTENAKISTDDDDDCDGDDDDDDEVCKMGAYNNIVYFQMLIILHYESNIIYTCK